MGLYIVFQNFIICICGDNKNLIFCSHNFFSRSTKIPPWREHGGRTRSVTLEGFRDLQRITEAFEEQMHRGKNLVIRGESEDEGWWI